MGEKRRNVKSFKWHPVDDCGVGQEYHFNVDYEKLKWR